MLENQKGKRKALSDDDRNVSKSNKTTTNVVVVFDSEQRLLSIRNLYFTFRTNLF